MPTAFKDAVALPCAAVTVSRPPSTKGLTMKCVQYLEQADDRWVGRALDRNTVQFIGLGFKMSGNLRTVLLLSGVDLHPRKRVVPDTKESTGSGGTADDDMTIRK